MRRSLIFFTAFGIHWSLGDLPRHISRPLMMSTEKFDRFVSAPKQTQKITSRKQATGKIKLDFFGPDSQSPIKRFRNPPVDIRPNLFPLIDRPQGRIILFEHRFPER